MTVPEEEFSLKTEKSPKPINSGSRTFAPAERFTVKSAPLPFALKPVALYLSEGKVKADAWQIHDVRINERSQLDGDTLTSSLFSPHNQPGLAKAITSGFDTITSGGTIALDVSFQGALSDEQTPFYAALFGLEVEPARDVTEYSGMIRLRGEDDTLVAAVCDEPPRVLPGKSAWFVARPKDLPFCPKRLVIDRCWQDWEIEDVHVDGRTQFCPGGIGPIPGELFQPSFLDIFTRFNIVPVAQPFAVKARYIGSNPRGGRFGLVAYGKVPCSAGPDDFQRYGELGLPSATLAHFRRLADRALITSPEDSLDEETVAE